MIGQAISNLSPNAKWRLEGNDYDNIEWFSDDIQKPTKEQVIAESTRLEEEAANAEQVKINAKTSALSKLAALGLTENEIKALTGTL